MQEHARSNRIRDYFLHDREPSLRIAFGHAVTLRRRYAFDLVLEIALLVHKNTFPVSKQQLKIACLGPICSRMINLVQDSLRQREPNSAAWRVCRSDTVFISLRPARL